MLSLKEALVHFVHHRRDVVTRRTQFDLRQAQERMHILEGLKIAVDNIDAVIDLIRSSKDTETAKSGLIETFELSARQAQAILDMRLAKLTGLEREALIAGDRGGGALIARLEGILGSETMLIQVIVTELEEVRTLYGDDRRTEITDLDVDIDLEDMIAPEEMVVTVTHGGYVKRSPKNLYRAQSRGGRGITGAATHEEDFVSQMFVASTHDNLLMFTSKGRVYAEEGLGGAGRGPHRQGQGLRQPAPLQEGERVVALLPVREFSEGAFVVMATRRGTIKKTSLGAFTNIRHSGIIALSIEDDDALVGVRITEGRATCCWARATAGPSASARRTCGPMGRIGARRARHQAARGRRLRWWAWRWCRASSRRRC